MKIMKELSVPITTTNNPHWGVELPGDIMRVILEKLFFGDQARFLAVCRTWHGMRETYSIPPPLKQLPWLFTMNFHKDEQGHSTWCCKLFDPTYKNKYITHVDDFDCRNQDWYMPKRWESAGCEVWASIEGWLLLSLRSLRRGNNFNFFIFFNPFTKKKIQLPCLKSHFLIATCFSPPTSSQCVVFVLTGFQSRYTTLHTWRANDKTWTATTLKKSMSINIKRIVHLSDILYCYSTEEKMLAIDLSGNKVGEISFPDLPKSSRSVRMVESDGELLLVCVRNYYHGPKADYTIRWRATDESWDIPLVFHLVDPLGKKSWVRLETLGNRALFLTCNYAISLDVSNQATTSLLEADGIYSAAYAPFLVVYSLKKDSGSYISRIYHSFSSNNEKWVGYVEPPKCNS